MNKRNKNPIYIILVAIFFVLLPLCTIFLSDLGHNNERVVTPEQENVEWYYLNSDGTSTKITIPNDIEGIEVNEEYTIYTDLKQNSSYNDTLYVYSIHQTIKVYIDGELFYSNSNAHKRLFGKAEKSKIHLISLPDDAMGKRISITFSCPYTMYSGHISDVLIDSRNNLVDYIFQKNIAFLGISLVFLCASLALFFSSFIFLKTYPEFTKVNNVLASSIFLSLFFILESKILSLITSINTSNIAYICLIFFNIFVNLYLYKDAKNYKRRFIPLILLILNGIHLISSCVLQILGILDLFETLLFTLILENAHIIYLLIYKLHVIKTKIHKGLTKSDVFETIMSAFILLSNTFVGIVSFSNTGLFIIPGAIFMIYVFVRYSMSINEVVSAAKEKEEYEEQLKETKNYLIQSQMKSHFIFNTLGAIRTMIVSSPKQAYDMTTNFTKYLRANISNISPNEQIPFAHELDHIRAYVNIELHRFPTRLKVEYDIQADNFLIPPLSVEPLVENAVKHGVCKKLKGGTVVISTREETDRFVVTVADDGVGFDTAILDEEEKKDSVGLKYIKIRLETLANAEFKIISVPGKGTKATIIIKK